MTKIYEAKHHVCIHTGYANPIEHCHTAAHIIISLYGMMNVKCDGEPFLCHGVVIPAKTPHQIDTYDKDVLVFLYAPTADVTRQIKNIRCISEENCSRIVQKYSDFEHEAISYSAFEEALLEGLGFTAKGECMTDERILSAIKYMHSSLSKRISCKEVADAVFLSQGRFSHLFRKQMGMTFAAYLIYQRLLYVYAAIIQGKSITEAALDAGFSSSSHFADVNRRVFGISASSITKDVTFTKV